jgi:transposase-like protein
MVRARHAYGTHQRRIEREFDSSIVQLIQDFREDGCSWETVAGIFGISDTTLLVWRKFYNLEVNQAIRRGYVRDRIP